ncbi:MAG: tol-pal system YbgF family protein [Bacteroidia bacterium]
MTDKKENAELNLDKTIVETTHRVEDFYHKYKKQINYVLIGIVVVVAGYVSYERFYIAPMEEEGQKEIFRAQQYFEKDSFNLALKGNDKFKGFEDIAHDYSGSKAGNLARYYAGICLLRTGKYEEAIEQLEKFSTGNKMVGPVATGAIGDAYVELGDLDKGVKHYLKAAKMSKNKLTAPVFYKKAGLVYEEKKDYAEALKVYKVIKEDFRESQEAGDIDKYIARATALSESK